MKKLILSSLIILTALISNAQSPSITIDHKVQTWYIGSVPTVDLYTHNFANEVIETTPAGPQMVIDLFVENMSGNTIEWIASRRRINVDASWNDFLCWGHSTDNFGGQCIGEQQMDTNIWVDDCAGIFAVDVAPGDSAVLSAHIDPNLSQSGCGTYRYYIGTCANPFIDSVDINICYTVGLDENEATLNVSIAPNPAKESINIATSNNAPSTYKLHNSVGQEVMSGAFVEATKLDATNLENGVYFIIVEAEGLKAKTEKIIINH